MLGKKDVEGGGDGRGKKGKGGKRGGEKSEIKIERERVRWLGG